MQDGEKRSHFEVSDLKMYRSQPLSITKSGIFQFIEPSGDDYVENYEKIAAYHLDSLDQNGTNPFIGEAVWDSIDDATLEILKTIMGPGDTILDAGVGLGALLRNFPDHARYGVDVSQQYLERIADRGIGLALAKLENLPYKDETFDVVISTDVLEHVIDFHAASREIVRVLKPGGHLVMRVPLEEDMEVYYNYTDFKYVHLRRFDLWTLRIQFERILGLHYVSHKPVRPVYRGIGTARVRPTDRGGDLRRIVQKLPANFHGKEELEKFSYLTPDLLNHVMNAVAGDADIFPELTEIIANDLEINVVFRKA